jgi:hypothetical protein
MHRRVDGQAGGGVGSAGSGHTEQILNMKVYIGCMCAGGGQSAAGVSLLSHIDICYEIRYVGCHNLSLKLNFHNIEFGMALYAETAV